MYQHGIDMDCYYYTYTRNANGENQISTTRYKYIFVQSVIYLFDFFNDLWSILLGDSLYPLPTPLREEQHGKMEPECITSSGRSRTSHFFN